MQLLCTEVQNATYPKARRAAVSLSVLSCSEWGLHSLLRYRKSGGLLHRHSTLTGKNRRFLFCCTGLRVAPTGRYPAPCPVEPGLSSPLRARSSVLLCSILAYFFSSVKGGVILRQVTISEKCVSSYISLPLPAPKFLPHNFAESSY